MIRTFPLRRIPSRTRTVLAALALMVAQLGAVMHPLHAEQSPSGQQIEFVCAFCATAVHLHAAPAAPALKIVPPFVVGSCIEFAPLRQGGAPLTSRLTRGPPLATCS